MMKRRAFTLVELLVVIAIISLLSTVAVVSLNQARSKSRDAKRIADIRQITIAMQMYREDKGHYPNTGTTGADALNCNVDAGLFYCLGHGTSGTCWTTPTRTGCNALDSALAPYMPKIPDDPENATGYTGDAYLYEYNGVLAGQTAPLVIWAMDIQTSASACLGGGFGQYGAIGRNRWYCVLGLPS